MTEIDLDYLLNSTPMTFDGWWRVAERDLVGEPRELREVLRDVSRSAWNARQSEVETLKLIIEKLRTGTDG